MDFFYGFADDSIDFQMHISAHIFLVLKDSYLYAIDEWHCMRLCILHSARAWLDRGGVTFCLHECILHVVTAHTE